MIKPKTEKKTLKGGAKAKLRQHFLANIGRVMDSDELRVVAENQSEWARRVRELRTEEGYLILTHNDWSELKPGQYLLENPKPAPAFERAISKETRALCSVCNEGASNATLTRLDLQKLLIQVRRASAADQAEVLKWLRMKFPKL